MFMPNCLIYLLSLFICSKLRGNLSSFIELKRYNYFIMSKVDIEYCGSWGFGVPATKLKNAIATALKV